MSSIRRHLTVAISIAVVCVMLVSALPILRVQAAANNTWSNSQTYQGIWPATDVVMNQTVGNYASNSRAHLELSANMWQIDKGSSSTSSAMTVSTAVTASARKQIGYTYSGVLTSIDIEHHSVAALTSGLEVTCDKNAMGDDGGQWVNVSKFYNDYSISNGLLPYFYGDYYSWMFISSNGFLVLTHTPPKTSTGALDIPAAWKTKTPPSSVPSTAAPNTIIAPYWRDLNPTLCPTDGGVRYGFVDEGYHGGHFVVFWEKVPNYVNSLYQSFFVAFDMFEILRLESMELVYSSIFPLESIEFGYKSVDGSNAPSTKIFIEDQGGKSGVYAGTGTLIPATSVRFISFTPTGASFYVIKDLSMNVDKYYYDPSWGWLPDAGSWLSVSGYKSAFPSAFNLDLSGPLTYKWYPTTGTWWATADFALALIGMATVTGGVGGIVLGALGVIVSSRDFLGALAPYPVPSTGTPWTEDSEKDLFAKYYTHDGNMTRLPYADYAWDVGLAPQFQWNIPAIDSISNPRKLVITTTATIAHFSIRHNINGAYISYDSEEVITTSIEPGTDHQFSSLGIQLVPNTPFASAQWYGRTIPDGKYFQTNEISTTQTSYGRAFHIYGSVNSNANHDIVAWNITRTSTDAVRSDGTIRVEGWFKQYDSYGDSRSATNVYVMKAESDAGKFTVLKKVAILTSTDGQSTWKFKSLLITGLPAGQNVKIGIGRTVYAVTGQAYLVGCQFTGVEIRSYQYMQGYTQWSLNTEINTGGGVDPDPAATYWYWYTSTSLKTVRPEPVTGKALGYWTVNGVNTVGTATDTAAATYKVGADKDYTVKPNYVDSTKRCLLVSRNSASGGTLSIADGINQLTKDTVVSVRATPANKYVLNYWIMDGARVPGIPNPLVVTMNTNHEIKAYFLYNSGCVAEGTLVTMADRNTMPIEDLKVGDRVMGYDVDASASVSETILSITSTKVPMVLIINDGALVVTPLDQPLYVRTPDGVMWNVDPVNVQVGWQLYEPLKDSWVTIYSVQENYEKVRVYDFTTDGPQTYLANSFLVLDKPIPV